MRIALVGPAAPDTDPLVRYTLLLLQQLRAGHDIRLYPTSRPHRTCAELDAQDFGTDSLPACHGKPTLSPCNPLTWLRAILLLRRFRPQVVLLPWHTLVWAPALWVLAVLTKFACGARILFLCHHVGFGSGSALASLCTRAAFTAANGFLVHTRDAQARLMAAMPSAHCDCAPYPHTFTMVRTGICPQSAREALGVSGNVLLFFAFAQAHRGLLELLRAMPSILKKVDLTLLVVGALGKKEDEMRALAWHLGIRERVLFCSRFVPDRETEVYFAAADLVVLPASDNGLGIARIAHTMGRPVVAPKSHSLDNMVEPGKTGYIVAEGDPAAIAYTVTDYFAFGRAAEMRPYVEQAPLHYSWEFLANTVQNLTANAIADTEAPRVADEPVVAVST